MAGRQMAQLFRCDREVVGISSLEMSRPLERGMEKHLDGFDLWTEVHQADNDLRVQIAVRGTDGRTKWHQRKAKSSDCSTAMAEAADWLEQVIGVTPAGQLIERPTITGANCT